MITGEDSCTALKTIDAVQITRILFDFITRDVNQDEFIILLYDALKNEGLPLHGITLTDDKHNTTVITSVVYDRKKKPPAEIPPEMYHLLQTGQVLTTKKGKLPAPLITISPESTSLLCDNSSLTAGNKKDTSVFFILPLITDKKLQGTLNLIIPQKGPKLPLNEIHGFFSNCEIIARGIASWRSLNNERQGGKFKQAPDNTVEEERLKNINQKLEDELTRKISILEEKEKHLHTLVSTVHHIESGARWSERLGRIITGFTALDAESIALVIREEEQLSVSKIFPAKLKKRLTPLLGDDPEKISFSMTTHRLNPFTLSVEMVNPVFFVSDEGIRDFFDSTFPSLTGSDLEETLHLFEKKSIIIFPLETKDGAEGAIAVSASLETLENNFEYFQLLGNTAAVEINRKKNADVLAESERRYRSLIESSRDMIIFCSHDGTIRLLNRTFYEKTGMKAPLTEKKSLFDLIRPEKREVVKKMITGALTGSEPREPIEILLCGKNIRKIWTEMTVTRAADNGDNLHIALRDISYRKNLETQLSDIASMQEQIIQTDMIGIVTMDMRGMITRWNSGAREILGYGEIEVLGKNIREFIVPTRPTLVKQKPAFPGTLEMPATREVILKKNDGTTITAMYAEEVMKDSNGRPILIVSFFFDVTEKVSLEERSRELMRQLSQAQQVTILSLAKLTEYRDLETGSHLERIMKYTEILAQELSGVAGYSSYITDDYILDLVSSCPLHDIGKVGIPDYILHKPGKLTPEEFEVMKNHTIIGGDTIREAEEKLQSRSYLNLGREVAYYHHEKWDGTGYPRGLSRDEIPLSARIVAVADVYDALISKRPYKDAYEHATAADIIKHNGGSHFDPAITDAFRRCEGLFEEYSEVAFQEVSREGFFSQEIDIDGSDLN